MFFSKIKSITYKTAQMANPLMLGFAANLLLIIFFFAVLKRMLLHKIRLMERILTSHRVISFAFSQD